MNPLIKRTLTIGIFMLFVITVRASPYFEQCLKSMHYVVKRTQPSERNEALIKSINKLDREKFQNHDEYVRFLTVVDVYLSPEDKHYGDALLLIAENIQSGSRFKEAYPFLYKVARIVEEGVGSVSRICKFYEVIGNSYYFFKRMSLAEKMLRKGINCDDIPAVSKISMRNTLGLIRREFGDNEGAEVYFKSALKIAEETNNEPWRGVISGNLGSIYYSNGDQEKSIELIETDYRISTSYMQWESAIMSLCILTEVNIKSGAYEEARKQLSVLDSLMKQHGTNYTSIYYYSAKTLFFETLGEYEKALYNFRLLKQNQEEVDKEKDLLNIQNIEFQLDFERKQSEVWMLEKREQINNERIIGLWVGIVLILLGSAVSIWQISKRRKREQEVLELKNQRAKESLDRLEEDLQGALLSLMEKNEMVFQLKDEIKRWEEKANDQEKEELADRMESISLMTNEGWHKFKRLFDKRFKGFLASFETKFPDLTNAEVRLIALIKLNLGSTEMSKALGIGVDSVRKTNLRLRKKLGIMDQHELKKLIQNS